MLFYFWLATVLFVVSPFAVLAYVEQAIFVVFSAIKKLGCSRIFLSTRACASLVRDILYRFEERFFNWLSIQIVKIECALREVFWYNVIHGNPPYRVAVTSPDVFVSIVPSIGTALWGQTIFKLTPPLYHEATSRATLGGVAW
jgi:predicted secreted protein